MQTYTCGHNNLGEQRKSGCNHQIQNNFIYGHFIVRYVLWVVFFVFEMIIRHIGGKKPENINFHKRSLRSCNPRCLIL